MALASGWYIGYAIGLVVVLIAAALLIIIITLGRRIVGQAESITSALDGAREHTDGLFDVRHTNFAVDRITRGLRTVRTGGPDHEDEGSRDEEQPGPVGRLTRGLRRGFGADEA